MRRDDILSEVRRIKLILGLVLASQMRRSLGCGSGQLLHLTSDSDKHVAH